MGARDIIGGLLVPKPPPQLEIKSVEDAAQAIDALNRFTYAWVQYENTHRQFISDFIESAEIDSLSADKITAGTITTDKIYLGDSTFELDGILKQIRVYDNQPTPQLRIEFGAFGTGSSYGIKCYDASGVLRFQVADTTFIDGAIIKDATIVTPKLVDGAVTTAKLADGSVTDIKVSNLSANKITTGTLTVSSTSVAINVTSGGAVILQSGADIIFKRGSTGDYNWLKFQDSAGNDEAQIGLYKVINALVMTSGGGRIRMNLDGSIGLQCASGKSLNISASVINGVFKWEISLEPSVDNALDLGSSTRRWRSLYVVNKPCVIETDSGMTTLWAIESPEYRFLDWGSVFVNKRQHVSLDRRFTECIDESEYLVFLTPEANTRCWIENKTEEGFDIVTDAPCQVNYMISAFREGWKNLRFFHADNTSLIPEPKVAKHNKRAQNGNKDKK